MARSFASVRDLRAAALVIVAALPFMSHIEQLATLTLRHAVPAIFPFREFPAAGGLARRRQFLWNVKVASAQGSE